MRESYGIPLAICERTGATLWPREDYPSADDALAAWGEKHDWWGGLGADGDLEMFPSGRVRLVWAWQVDPEQEPGWWMWRDGIGETPPHIECWEVTPR